ncbi:ovostatin-like [Lytechinus pictus]|uniref:ovostatin-like n=1 Tax=Lytechinus pictus TaxID=7653 RepID=UPI0030B9DA1B
MRLAISLIVVAIAVVVRGQLEEVVDEQPVVLEALPPIEEITVTPEAEITTAPATTTVSPEQRREDEFDQHITYLLVIPKVLHVGTTETICLMVTKCEGVLDYKVSFLRPVQNQYDTYEEYDEYSNEASQGENCFNFNVPLGEFGFSQKHRVRLQLRRIGSEDVNEDGYEVTTEKHVTMQAGGRFRTYIQTDKPIYQPGQKVSFRVLTLNRELKTVTEPFDSVRVERGGNGRVLVGKWAKDDLEGNQGLFELYHQLPDELPDGVPKLTYYIKATRGSESVTQTFDVEEYVLPKFDVQIITAPYILITDNESIVKVCGVYTYGQPVLGDVQANVTAKPRYYWYKDTSTILQLSGSTDSSGCAKIKVDLKAFQLTSSFINLDVVAAFTEGATGEVRTASSSTSLSADPFKLVFESRQNEYGNPTDTDYFRPGLPFFGAVKVTNPDGSPRSGEAVVIECKGLSSTAQASSNDDGFAEFVLPLQETFPTFDSEDSLSCTVTAEEYQEQASSSPGSPTLNRPIDYLSLSPLYSPTDNYLVIEPVIYSGKGWKAGDVINLPVHVTSCSDGPQILAVSRGHILRQDDIKYKAALREQEIGIIYDVSLKLTTSMTPLLNLLVYCLENGEMIADSIEIRSESAFENEVHIQVADGQNAQLEPGAETSIEIVASPGSLCAVGVVDQSVHLLGGNNQIQTSDVVSFLNTFQLSPGDNQNPPCLDNPTIVNENTGEPEPLPQPIRLAEPQVALQEEEFIAVARKKRQVAFPFFPSPYQRDPYPRHADVTKEFEQLGLVRMSNIQIETSPCVQPEPFPYYRSAQFAFAQADSAVAFASAALSAGPAIRTYFPETWLWYLQPSEESPTVTVPDTITRWEGSGFCISPETGFGVSSPFSVTAFKPFFADYVLPYSVIRGEELEFQVTVFNYLNNCLPVKVTVTRSDDFEITDGSNVQYSCVCTSAPSPVIYNIKPTKLGDVDLETTVVVEYDQSICTELQPIEFNVTHSDGLRKPLLVEPEGEEVAESRSLYFCPSDEEDGEFRHVFEIGFPDHYVEGSGRVIIQVTGDILGNSLTNIDQLLRIPYGCGEQNMIGFVPNIYALLYLRATNQDDPTQINKAKNNMVLGYRKQLNYRRKSGSYSAFGDRDESGSAWLTAYVVNSFAQASNFITIDPNDLATSIRWLNTTLKKDENQCFLPKGRVIHKEMQGGVNDEVTLTAYILISLIEAHGSTESKDVKGALSCIHTYLDSTGDLKGVDTYAAALIAYALSVAKDENVGKVLEHLESVAVNEGGLKYWKSSRPQPVSSRRYHHGASADSISIELTAYVLLTLINVYESGDAVVRGSPISKWLVTQQKPNGGFTSSQDTVVALHALAEYARLVYGGTVNLGVAFNSKHGADCSLNSLFLINEGNRRVLQSARIDDFPDSIEVLATGEGCAIIQVIERYNIHPTPPPEPPFILTYSVEPTGLKGSCVDNFKLKICVSYRPSGPNDIASNMALVEVKLVTGYIPDRPSLNQLRRPLSPTQVSRVEYKKKTVTVYFNEFTEKSLCFDFTVRRVNKVREPKPAIITVFDYYSPDTVLTTEYVMACSKRLPPVEIQPLPVEVQVEEVKIDIVDDGGIAKE